MKLDETPLLLCEICGQGSHNECILQTLGIQTANTVNPAQAWTIINPTGLPGLHYMCGACGSIPDKDAGLLTRKSSTILEQINTEHIQVNILVRRRALLDNPWKDTYSTARKIYKCLPLLQMLPATSRCRGICNHRRSCQYRIRNIGGLQHSCSPRWCSNQNEPPRKCVLSTVKELAGTTVQASAARMTIKSLSKGFCSMATEFLMDVH